MDLKKIIQSLTSGDEKKIEIASKELDTFVSELSQENEDNKQKATDGGDYTQKIKDLEEQLGKVKGKLEVFALGNDIDITGKSKEDIKAEISANISALKTNNETDFNEKLEAVNNEKKTIAQEKNNALELAKEWEEKFNTEKENQTLKEKNQLHKNKVLDYIDQSKNNENLEKNWKDKSVWNEVRNNLADKIMKVTSFADENLKFVKEDGKTQKMQGTRDFNVIDFLTEDYDNAKKQKEATGQGSWVWNLEVSEASPQGENNPEVNGRPEQQTQKSGVIV